MVPSASRQCLFWHQEICSWLFWRKSAISFDLNRIILVITSEESSWLTKITSWIAILEFRLQSGELSLSRTLVAWVRAGWSVGGCVIVLKDYCSVANTRAESEAFGKADQPILGCPRTCGGIHILARTGGCTLLWGLAGREIRIEPTQGSKRFFATAFSFSLTGSVFVDDMLNLHMDIFSSLCLFWISAVQCSFLEQLHTCKMNLVFFPFI